VFPLLGSPAVPGKHAIIPYPGFGRRGRESGRMRQPEAPPSLAPLRRGIVVAIVLTAGVTIAASVKDGAVVSRWTNAIGCCWAAGGEFYRRTFGALRRTDCRDTDRVVPDGADCAAVCGGGELAIAAAVLSAAGEFRHRHRRGSSHGLYSALTATAAVVAYGAEPLPPTGKPTLTRFASPMRCTKSFEV